ncbi:MAG: ABC transporter permease [bacterium]|nr:ABC transporter permease [bacterium]
MYREMFAGEWKKIAGQRWAALLFVWIAPIAALVFFGFLAVVALLSPGFREELADGTLPPWNDAFLYGWLMVNNEFGRYVIAAFTAIVFAGEYQWGTWKNFVPHRTRTSLLLTKFFTVGAFTITAWTAMSLIVGIGFGLMAVFGGRSYGAFNGEIFREFIGTYGLQMALTFTATLIAACYAALTAMFTRSVLVSFFVVIVLTILENGILLPLFLIYGFFDLDLLWLYRFVPTYNLANINAWLTTGTGFSPPGVGDGGVYVPPEPNALGLSLFIIVVWVVALLSVTLWQFRRQDITT